MEDGCWVRQGTVNQTREESSSGSGFGRDCVCVKDISC